MYPRRDDYVYPYSSQFINRLKHIDKSRKSESVSSSHDVLQARADPRQSMRFTPPRSTPRSTGVVITAPVVSGVKTRALSRGRSRSKSAESSRRRRSRSGESTRSGSYSTSAPLGFGSSSSTSRVARPANRAESPSPSVCSYGHNSVGDRNSRTSSTRPWSCPRPFSVNVTTGPISNRFRKPTTATSPLGFGSATKTHREPPRESPEKRGRSRRRDFNPAVTSSTCSSRKKSRSKSSGREKGDRNSQRKSNQKGKSEQHQSYQSQIRQEPHLRNRWVYPEFDDSDPDCSENAADFILHRDNGYGNDNNMSDQSSPEGYYRRYSDNNESPYHDNEYIDDTNHEKNGYYTDKSGHVDEYFGRLEMRNNMRNFRTTDHYDDIRRDTNIHSDASASNTAEASTDYFLDLTEMLDTKAQANNTAPPTSKTLPSSSHQNVHRTRELQEVDIQLDFDHLHQNQQQDKYLKVNKRDNTESISSHGTSIGDLALNELPKKGKLRGDTNIAPGGHNRSSEVVNNKSKLSEPEGQIVVIPCRYTLEQGKSFQATVIIRSSSTLDEMVRAVKRQLNRLPEPDFDMRISSTHSPTQEFSHVLGILADRHSDKLVPFPHIREDSAISIEPCSGERDYPEGDTEEQLIHADVNIPLDQNQNDDITSDLSDNDEDNHSRPFHELYELREVLGSGSFSTVRRAVHKKSGKALAVKCMDLNTMPPEVQQQLYHEVDILQALDHPNVLQFVGFFMDDNGQEDGDLSQTEQMCYLVTEILEGGELFDRIIKKTAYNERDARDLLFIIISTVAHVHAQGIVHRDLKPENLLMVDSADDSSVKIADFGLAEITDGFVSLETPCGTPGYVAPEILSSQKYGKACDMWSVGVIMYVILGGYLPFEIDNYMQNVKNPVEFHPDPWNDISADAKDLIRKLLTVDPLIRYTAEEALRHSWMSRSSGSLASKQLEATLQNLKHYHRQRKFKGAAKAVIATRRLSLVNSNEHGTLNREQPSTTNDTYGHIQKQTRQSSSIQRATKKYNNVYSSHNDISSQQSPVIPQSSNAKESLFSILDDSNVLPRDLTLDDLGSVMSAGQDKELESPPDDDEAFRVTSSRGGRSGSSRRKNKKHPSHQHDDIPAEQSRFSFRSQQQRSHRPQQRSLRKVDLDTELMSVPSISPKSERPFGDKYSEHVHPSFPHHTKNTDNRNRRRSTGVHTGLF